MKSDVQVYTTQTSSRLEYAVDLVLGNILGLSYTITDSPDVSLPLINYSYDRSIGGIFIQPEGLLFQKGIRMQQIWVAHLNGIPLFFQQPPEAGFQLDIFSFAFYMVTRYEEYLTVVRDEHGRFSAESSLAYKHNFLDKPVVDIWVHRLGATLKLLYPDMIIPEKKHDHLLMVEVNEPFEFRGKGIVKNLGGLLTDTLTANRPARRFRCMTGSMKDSYDTYAYINENAKKYNSSVLYFFATGDRSRFDKNINPNTRCYKKLIRRLSKEYIIGLHSSYSSGNSEKLILKEKEKLESITQQKVTKLKKHHLLLTIPFTYHVIQSTGFEEDYTLGYIREAGFRAGIARPFKFYDLTREETSLLTLVPFQYMESTFQKYKRYDPLEAIESVSKLINWTKQVGGLFVSVWHNTSLTDEGEWEGWRQLFEYTLREQLK
ncbi:MAG: polysaccharide deacetylase family protein [Bacteroidota bacterium]|nr:polysaccharide deacetylase family protein [Bacteroidota bacterium]